MGYSASSVTTLREFHHLAVKRVVVRSAWIEKAVHHAHWNFGGIFRETPR